MVIIYLGFPEAFDKTVLKRRTHPSGSVLQSHQGWGAYSGEGEPAQEPVVLVSVASYGRDPHNELIPKLCDC